ncbi:hypothetical protein MLD38_007365 [Melastoma candidum]|uniref:Uncharacterized protein n=1 Tax=Melastoma candidum TaxID=119954 RepID=A0ACB9RZF2_9MYRT|nr:hypothetical protein MLD38_007365 [Melastoma candidum]
MCNHHAAATLVLSLTVISFASGAFVGVNIGTDVSGFPSASNVVSILRSHGITHVRLYDASASLLEALSNTGVEVMVGITNEEVQEIGRSPGAAAAWVTSNVAAHVPLTNITAIVVGSQVLTSVPKVAAFLVPAMNNIHRALVFSNLNYRVKVSTPLSMDIIPNAFPPSAAEFNPVWKTMMYEILRFLKNTNSSFLMNAFPYYGYSKSDGIFPIDYVLFQPLPAVKQIVDSNTLLRYDSMFEAMVDAAYYSMAALNFTGIPVTVTETGWPWAGGTDEPDATLNNAETFNTNLVKRVMNGSGPPSQPGIPINAYLYEMFDEDNRPGSESGRSWGVFFTNGSSIYPIVASTENADNSSEAFCMAKEGVDEDRLQDGLNWACGQGRGICAALQPGQPCYTPNTVRSHASYAYNEYYQRMKNAGGTCDFQGTAIITSINPSYGSCIYSGSMHTNSSSSRILPPYTLAPASPLTVGKSEALAISIVSAAGLLMSFAL